MGLDALEFLQAVTEARYADALDLYEGRFLDGFTISGAPQFEQWQETVCATLDREALVAGRKVLEDAEARAQWSEVQRVAGKLLQSDPFDETAHRSRLKSLIAQGEHARAADELTRLATFFDCELGRGLSAETSRLADLIVLSTASSPDAEAQEPSQALPFVGRTKEFQQLRDEWDKVHAGEGRAVVVLGEAGIGKTRLCSHFLRLGVLRGARVFEGCCFASEFCLPYSAIGEALSSGLRPEDTHDLAPVWVAALAQLLPDVATSKANDTVLPVLGGEGARRRLFEGIARVLEAVAQRSPVILFVDDFQWADESTVSLIHYLARRSRSSRFLVLLAARPEDISFNSSAWSLVRDFPARQGTSVIELGQLERDEVSSLIVAIAQHMNIGITQDITERIWTQCGGRPFFLLETLRAIGDLGLHGVVAAKGSAGADLTLLAPSIESFLQKRLRALPERHRDCLAVLSVLGNSADNETLQRLASIDALALARVTQELVERGYVREENGQICFTHDLLREASYRGLAGIVRRVLHKRAADVLVAAGAEPGLVTNHLDLAGEREAAFDQALLAAKASESVFAHWETEHYLGIAIGNASTTEQRADVKLRLAHLLFQLRRFSDADHLFDEVERFFAECGHADGRLWEVQIARIEIYANEGRFAAEDILLRLRDLRVRLDGANRYDLLAKLLRIAAVVAHDAGRMDEIFEAIDALKALGITAAQTPAGVQALRMAANLVCFYTDATEGLAIAQTATKSAEELHDPELLIDTLIMEGNAQMITGRLGPALACHRRALEACERVGAIGHRPKILNSIGVVLLEKGEYDQAVAIFHELLALAPQMDVRYESLLANANLAIAAIEGGDLETAADRANCILALQERSPSWWSAFFAHGVLGLNALARGRVREALRYRREIVHAFEARPFWTSDFSYTEMFLARLAAFEGDVAGAIQRLDEAIHASEKRDFFCWSRLQLERAKLIVTQRPDEARTVALMIRDLARQSGAVPLVEKADAVLDRLALMEA